MHGIGKNLEPFGWNRLAAGPTFSAIVPICVLEPRFEDQADHATFLALPITCRDAGDLQQQLRTDIVIATQITVLPHPCEQLAQCHARRVPALVTATLVHNGAYHSCIVASNAILRVNGRCGTSKFSDLDDGAATICTCVFTFNILPH